MAISQVNHTFSTLHPSSPHDQIAEAITIQVELDDNKMQPVKKAEGAISTAPNPVCPTKILLANSQGAYNL